MSRTEKHSRNALSRSKPAAAGSWLNISSDYKILVFGNSGRRASNPRNGNRLILPPRDEATCRQVRRKHSSPVFNFGSHGRSVIDHDVLVLAVPYEETVARSVSMPL